MAEQEIKKVQLGKVYLALAVAACFWFLIFGLGAGNFWVPMALAALLLALMASFFQGPPFKLREITLTDVAIGVASAAVLYGVFFVGNIVSRWIFSFAGSNIAAIYGNRSLADPWLIALVLIFVTSPAEEIFWRGFVQRQFAAEWGGLRGWLLGAVVYAGVHIFSLNPILILAAFVGGLGWGLIFWWRRSPVPGMISHIIWTVAIFVLFPLS